MYVETGNVSRRFGASHNDGRPVPGGDCKNGQPGLYLIRNQGFAQQWDKLLEPRSPSIQGTVQSLIQPLDRFFALIPIEALNGDSRN